MDRGERFRQTSFLASPAWVSKSLAGRGNLHNTPLTAQYERWGREKVGDVSSEQGAVDFRYGSTMNHDEEFSPSNDASAGESQSASIDAIRDRIASVQNRELDEHVAEYDGIHAQLERALTAIDGL